MIILEKCKGNPTMKIGTNDFFNNLKTMSDDSTYNGEKIYRPQKSTDDYEYVIIQDD